MKTNRGGYSTRRERIDPNNILSKTFQERRTVTI
jgi:hypothetical protein